MKKINIFLVITMCFMLFLSGKAFASKPGPKDSGPRYYSLEDLRAELKCYEFYFANMNKPYCALVDLGFNLVYPASVPKRTKIKNAVLSSPATYRVNATKIQSNWNDNNSLLDFNWNKFFMEAGGKGDLIFTRANSKDADLVKIFSNWTHVAIAYDVFGKRVFESMPKTGVKVNYAPDSWGQLTYYTCKRVETIPFSARISLVDDALQYYGGVKYYVGGDTGIISRFMNLFKWADKNNMESMYCSKLVWHAFKPMVDFDTQNTSVRISNIWSGDLIDKTPGAPIFAWIGVSPDDIYYSKALGWDFCYSDNCRGL